MTHCPKCFRPVNEGNSPNAAECHETDDDEGLCAAYAEIHRLRVALGEIVDLSRLPYNYGYRMGMVASKALRKTQ